MGSAPASPTSKLATCACTGLTGWDADGRLLAEPIEKADIGLLANLRTDTDRQQWGAQSCRAVHTRMNPLWHSFGPATVAGNPAESWLKRTEQCLLGYLERADGVVAALGFFEGFDIEYAQAPIG